MSGALNLQLNQFFASQPVDKAWVFGSFARGEETPKSDIDILVRFSESIGLLGYCDIICKLEKLTGRSVDLVQEGQLKDFAVESAERDKILVYERER